MNKDNIRDFCTEFLARSSRYSNRYSESKNIKLGSHSVRLRINTSSYFGELISEAFLQSNSNNFDFELQVWDSSFPEDLPETSFAENYVTSNLPIDFEISKPFKVLFDRGQGMIYVYDTERNLGSVWMRDHSQVDVRCCVAPFRVILSWMAHNLDAEIIHASATEINGKGVLISGASGSGKSSLALYSGMNGGKILSDDAVLIEGSKAYSIYSRAKIAKVNPVLDVNSLKTFELRNSTEGKSILPLMELKEHFIHEMEYNAIVFPEIVHMTHIERVSSLIGYKYFIDQSLRELFGGDSNNLARHSKLLTQTPNFRMALSGNISKDYECLVKQISAI
jgi:hypothetical protein